MHIAHIFASGMGGIRTAGDLVAWMQLIKKMKINAAKHYVAEKLGVAIADLVNEEVMRQLREDLGIGIIIEGRSVRFSTQGSIVQRILRLVLGVAILVPLWQGLDILFEGLNPPIIFRTIRYGCVGLWGALGAPWLFVKIGLAGQMDAADDN